MCSANTCKQGSRQKLPIRQSPPQLIEKHPHTLLSRSLFHEANDRLEVGPKADLLRGWFCAKGSQAAERRPVHHAQGRGARRHLKKSPSGFVHRGDFHGKASSLEVPGSVGG